MSLEKLTRRNFLQIFNGLLLSSALMQDLNASTTGCGDITKKADYIVEGYVKNKRYYRLIKSKNPMENEVFTDYYFKIEEYIKGKPLMDNKIVISTYGGQVDFKNMIYIGNYTKGKQEDILTVLPRKIASAYINYIPITVRMPENKKIRVHLHESSGKYWVTCGNEGMKILE